uniref:Uncharacterized protein n=1 Tax=Ascaris lumbricoides TaxID=6252 RepID=A0A0M3II71_ASCLU
MAFFVYESKDIMLGIFSKLSLKKSQHLDAPGILLNPSGLIDRPRIKTLQSFKTTNENSKISIHVLGIYDTDARHMNAFIFLLKQQR